VQDLPQGRGEGAGCDRLIIFPELRRKYDIPYCRLHINRLVEQGIFPAPVWLSPNRKAWWESQILEYRANLSTRRPPPPKPVGDSPP
jgi:predicted DNA-binding transcriptional regulator AlpA